MDKLEKFIKENREAFDVYDAPDFEATLNKIATSNTDKKPNKPLWLGISIAASILLVFGIGFFIGNMNQTKEIRLVQLKNMYPEYAQAEVFYTKEIEEEISSIREADYKLLGIDESFKNELQLKNDTYKSLYKSLAENPQNEQVAIAIIAYYQSKLELLNSLKTELNFAKNNIHSHEKTNH